MRLGKGARLFKHRIDRDPGHRLEVRFSRAGYEPGEAVSGVIAAADGKARARELRAELAYVEHSSDYVEHAAHHDAGTLHRGPLAPGDEVPFTLRLPADALPNWEPGDPELAKCARLSWEVVVTATRWGFLPDRVERHRVPLGVGSEKWSGPHPEEVVPEVTGGPDDWDVSLDLRTWTVRRGEEVRASVTIGSPAADREGLEAALICELHYDVEDSAGTGPSGFGAGRTTRDRTVHEERLALDPSAPLQEVRLGVPEEAPFSFGERKTTKLGPITVEDSTGSDRAVAVEWKVVVREARRLRRDHYREAEIQVLP